MTYNVLFPLVKLAYSSNFVTFLRGDRAPFGGPPGQEFASSQDMEVRVDVTITLVVYLVIMVSMY